MLGKGRHYERAFESLLRALNLPYLKVDDARRALLPSGASLEPYPGRSLKSFDYMVYSERSLLVEVKGRKGACARSGRARPLRFENWTTRDDLASLLTWEELFGEGFAAVVAFVYAFEEPPALDGRRVVEQDGLWFAVLAARACVYQRHARTRSPRWGTVSVPAARFREISVEIDQLCALPAPAAAVGS